MPTPAGPFDLNRCIKAQQTDYATALAEVKAGRKRSHWIWYILPQYTGLGASSTSMHYAIKSIDEAKAYLAHPILGPELIEITQAVLDVQDKTAHHIFGSPADIKLRSSATLFSFVAPAARAFEQVLGRIFNNERDQKTIELLRSKRS